MSTLQLSGLGKYYRVYPSPRDRFLELLLGKKRHTDYWVLQDVDLNVESGEAIGIIGNNGAGKSTLLKLVAGTLVPSVGHVTYHGRLTAILELGTGFHPEFTGRDNLYYAGSLMGVGRNEISARYEQIVDFADLHHVIDQPLKTYSTGMVVRLAFSLVTSVDPETLIIDEALAVGDRIFQKKCLKRMVEIQRSGTTILFCSHSMHHIMQFCTRVLWLQSGRVRELGEASKVVDQYISESLTENQQGFSLSKTPTIPEKDLPCSVNSVEIGPTTMKRRGDALMVTMHFTVLKPAEYVFGLAIDRKETGTRLVAETSLENGCSAVAIDEGDHSCQFSVDTSCLRSGVYTLYAGLLDDTLLKIEAYETVDFEVNDVDCIRSPAMVRSQVQWDLDRHFL